jgi:hypothetical protein
MGGEEEGFIGVKEGGGAGAILLEGAVADIARQLIDKIKERKARRDMVRWKWGYLLNKRVEGPSEA